MNNFFKTFLTVVVIIATGLLFSLGYNFLRMTDTTFNIGGLLLLTVTALGAYWCFYQLWIKDIPKDETLFGSKRSEDVNPDEDKKEETK